MRTSASQLRVALMSAMPRDKWVELQDIYGLVEKSLSLSAADWDPPADYAKADAKWKRDLRTVIKRLVGSGQLQWDNEAHYLLSAGTAWPVATPPSKRPPFWAFVANPLDYEIERAVVERPIDSWVTKGRDIRAGDRGIIWKAAGGRDKRGLLAFFEVLTDPEAIADTDNPYWTPRARAAGAAAQAEERVHVAYITTPRLPIWLPNPVLDGLNPARARGGTIFSVDAQQWRDILRLSGGWPKSPEGEAVVAASRPRNARGQRRVISSTLRRAIEMHAVRLAVAHFEAKGWTVEDVGATESFDLRCRRGEEALHVEVKGTQSRGDAYLMTRNEIAHARNQYPNVALFCVHSIKVEAEDPPALSGGTAVCIHPWDVNNCTLEPVTYEVAFPHVTMSRTHHDNLRHHPAGN